MAKLLLFYGVDAAHWKMSNIDHLSRASIESKKVKISTICVLHNASSLWHPHTTNIELVAYP